MVPNAKCQVPSGIEGLGIWHAGMSGMFTKVFTGAKYQCQPRERGWYETLLE
jgi:hypothetical protein